MAPDPTDSGSGGGFLEEVAAYSGPEAVSWLRPGAGAGVGRGGGAPGRESSRCKGPGVEELGLFVGWISAVRADRDVLASFQSEQDLPLVDA